MIKTVIFDFDGTIADNFNNFCDIVFKFANKEGYCLMRDEVNFIIYYMGIRQLVEKMKLSKWKIMKFAYLGRKDFKKYELHVKPFLELIPVFMELKAAGYELLIVSSNSKANINDFLMKYNLKVFSFVYKTSLLGKDKVLQKIVEKHKYKEAEVVYVGDEVRDIEACKKAGLKMIAVTWGYNSKRLLEKNKPDFIIENPKDILGIVRNN